MTQQKQINMDVCIIGSGIAGSLLGMILAKEGLNVHIIEAGVHPKFAIGESTVPETTMLFYVLSERYDIPEIKHISNFRNVSKYINPSSGVKRSFSFVHHKKGQKQKKEHSTQLPTWAQPVGPDVHFFRQDTDAYFMAVAAKYGAKIHQSTKIKDIEINADGTTIYTDQDWVGKAQYIIDGSGYHSILANKMGFREKESSLKTNSRTIFTHMVDVKHYDKIHSAKSCGLAVPFSQSTLHHLVEEAWMWVIPFNNHKDATNPLCSVGICFNRELSPKTDISPEEEFFEFVDKYPDMKEHFKDAKAVRPWVSTDRLQYSSTKVIGDRFCLLPHAAAFIDPLFSSGLTITGWALNVLPKQILKSFKEKDFSTKNFDYYEEHLFNILRHYDSLISNAFTSFKSFDLWNAWHKYWVLANFLGVGALVTPLTEFRKTKNQQVFENYPYREIQSAELKEYRETFDEGAKIMDLYRDGKLSESDTIDQLYKNLSVCKILPKPWNIPKKEARYPSTFTILPLTRLVFWVKFFGPKTVKQYYVTGIFLWVKFIMVEMIDQFTNIFKESNVNVFRTLKEFVYSWNSDWKAKDVGGLSKSIKKPISATTLQADDLFYKVLDKTEAEKEQSTEELTKVS